MCRSTFETIWGRSPLGYDDFYLLGPGIVYFLQKQFDKKS
jgi:hypothetical protein